MILSSILNKRKTFLWGLAWFMNTIASIHLFKNHRNINDKKEMKNATSRIWQPVCGIGWLSLNDFVSLQIIMKSWIVLPETKYKL